MRARKHLSFANVLSLVALFVALGSGAYAASKIGSGDIKNNAVKSKHIKNDQVKSKDVKDENLKGKDVKDGKLTGDDVGDGSLTGDDVGGDSLGGDQIDESTLGKVPSAESASPPAYARVVGNGDVDNDRSKGVDDADVTLVGSVFCFSDLEFTPTHVQATVDWFGGLGDVVIHATVNPPNSFVSCPAGHVASARMVDASTGNAVTTPNFFISFFDDAG